MARLRCLRRLGKMRFWRNTSVATLPVGGTATLTTGTLGYEWDEEPNNGFRPAGLMRLSSTTLSGAQILLDYGSTYGTGSATHNLTLYRHTSGALVFGAGTVQWSWGLDSNHDRGSAAADVRMQQAMVNLLADMGDSAVHAAIGVGDGVGIHRHSGAHFDDHIAGVRRIVRLGHVHHRDGDGIGRRRRHCRGR